MIDYITSVNPVVIVLLLAFVVNARNAIVINSERRLSAPVALICLVSGLWCARL